MTRFPSLFLRFALLLAVPACGAGQRRGAGLTQAAPIAGLAAGEYDGWMPCRDLLEYGDFGVGTFDRLDGEMVVDQGRIHQVKSDGRVVRPDPEAKIPFATLGRFAPSLARPIEEPLSLPGLTQLIDRIVPSRNVFYGLRVEGEFARVKTRSVPPQSRPYPPLAQAARGQTEFELRGRRGVIVGFRTPSYAAGINVPGYHLHFLCADESCGGHVLELELTRGSLEIAVYRGLRLILPPAEGSFDDADLEADRSSELRRAEH